MADPEISSDCFVSLQPPEPPSPTRKPLSIKFKAHHLYLLLISPPYIPSLLSLNLNLLAICRLNPQLPATCLHSNLLRITMPSKLPVCNVPPSERTDTSASREGLARSSTWVTSRLPDKLNDSRGGWFIDLNFFFLLSSLVCSALACSLFHGVNYGHGIDRTIHRDYDHVSFESTSGIGSIDEFGWEYGLDPIGFDIDLELNGLFRWKSRCLHGFLDVITTRLHTIQRQISRQQFHNDDEYHKFKRNTIDTDNGSIWILFDNDISAWLWFCADVMWYDGYGERIDVHFQDRKARSRQGQLGRHRRESRFPACLAHTQRLACRAGAAARIEWMKTGEGGRLIWMVCDVQMTDLHR
jgi:hypothetical protein